MNAAALGSGSELPFVEENEINYAKRGAVLRDCDFVSNDQSFSFFFFKNPKKQLIGSHG